MRSQRISAHVPAAAAAAVCAFLALVVSLQVGTSRSRSEELQLVSIPRSMLIPQGQILKSKPTRQQEEDVGALNSWNSKGTMYIKTPGMFTAGNMGMNAGGAALWPSAPGGLGYPRPSITSNRFVPIDDEMQGDCVCDQPWTDHDHAIFEKIVCHCPRYMVPEPYVFPGNPPAPTELEYDDGCKCVVTDDNLATTCTCPIQQVDQWDYDAHPPKTERR